MNEELYRKFADMLMKMQNQQRQVMDDAMLFGDSKPYYNRPLTPQNAFSIGEVRGKITPILDIPTALRGDDRPAPNADEWETQMLRRLAGEGSTCHD